MARALVLVLAFAACGSAEYIRGNAATQIEAARAVEADKYAPYHWTRAKEYLRKSRERAAYADFQGANRFEKMAKEAAELAEQMAIAAKKDPKKRPLDLKPDVAPAKGDDKPDQPVAPAKDAP